MSANLAPQDLDREVAELLAEDGLAASSYETAVRAHQLAKILADAGRTDQAAALYRRSVRIKQRVLGPNHPEVATTLHNLALLFKTMGHVEEARSLWAEARAVLEP
ncbi:MAG: tetratricopeptide repeat protein [Acidimicrobiales bacterium]